MKMFRATGTAQADLNELTSGNLIVGMARGSGTSLVDRYGNIIQSQSYAIDTFLALQAIKKYTDNEIYFVGGYYKDTCTVEGFGTITRIHPVIGRMDTLGAVIDMHHYVLNSSRCTNAAGYLEMTDNEDVIAWGGDAMFFAMRTTTTGNVVWAKSFARSGGFQFIKELPGGDLLAGMNVDTAGAVVARMDAAGNFLWCKSYFRPKGMVHDAIIESDDSFIITGYSDSTNLNILDPLPPGFQPKLFVLKLNGEGEVQWCKGYQSVPNPWYTVRRSRIKRTLDGNYVLLATVGQEAYNFFHRPFWMKIDQNGDTLWTRSVGANDYEYYGKDLLATTDGGFLIDGRIWGDLPEGQASFAFLYKTDAEGHLPCEEHHSPLVPMDLFPTDSSLTLFATDGAVARPAFISEATYPPIIQYDGCIVTSTEDMIQKRNPILSPNPNTGRFTVQFKDPLMADSYYSVYDTMGKLLLQRPLPTGATVEDVDLARFGAGTYVLKFTSPDGVCHERVIVE